MRIAELFKRLAYGQLSNLSMNNGDGTLQEAKHPQIIQYTNEALLQLFSRFLLKEKQLIIEQVAHITNYHLKRRYAEGSGSDEDYHYIKDLPDDPFREDVIRVLAVYSEMGQCILNDQTQPRSLFTPQPAVLQVPDPEEGRPLSVLYQARHHVLDDRIGKAIPDQEIDIPFFLEGALQNYIGYLVYSHMNGQENIIKSQEYLAAYEATCLNVEQRDLVNQSFHTSHTKLEQRGFV